MLEADSGHDGLVLFYFLAAVFLAGALTPGGSSLILRALETLKVTLFDPAMFISSPDLGLRPIRGADTFRLNVPIMMIMIMIMMMMMMMMMILT